MIRRTITFPEGVAREIDDLVARGDVASVSRFFQDAAHRHLAALRGAQMAEQAALLDTDEEVATARATRRPRGRAPWGRLR